jgi:transposase
MTIGMRKRLPKRRCDRRCEQLDLQSLHRARERLVAERTALINQLRSLLLERGVTVPQGRRKLERELP